MQKFEITISAETHIKLMEYMLKSGLTVSQVIDAILQAWTNDDDLNELTPEMLKKYQEWLFSEE